MSDFTTKDFIDTYKELLESVKILTNKWDPSTSSEANVGVVLLKLIALIKDKLDYKQDLAESQAYLGEVSDRQNAFDLLQMLGYIMKEAKSAHGYVEITNTTGDSITLPAFSPVSDSTGEILYFTTEDHRFGAVDDETSFPEKLSIQVMEGSVFDIQKDGVDKYSVKDVDENGRFFLGKTGLAANGVFIGIYEGDKVNYSSWKNIDAGVIYPQGNYFYILTSETGENYIQFPENFASLLGSQTFVVKATYTKGSAGNCKKGSLIKIPTQSSSFTVRQYSDITTGENSETIRQAEDNYYSTMGTFKTLVSSSDYSAAIRYILHGANTLINGSKETSKTGIRRFSNCTVDSAIDRQKRIITRLDEKEYLYHCFDDGPTTEIDVTALKSSESFSSSDPYNTEFEIVNIDAEDYQNEKQDILEQLNDSQSFAVQLVSKNEYYIAKTLLTGIILANIETKQQSQEILEKVILSLKTQYKATNLTFGKKLDYNELLSTIKNADNRIISVLLEQPKYQIYKRTLESDTGLSLSDKEHLVIKSVLQGQVPLFKYANRPNTLSGDFSSGDYISIGLNAATFRGLSTDGTQSTTSAESSPSEIVPIITDINMNPSVLLDDTGKVLTLTSDRIAVQFNKKLYVTEIEYTYGTRYALLSTEMHTLTSDVNISETSYILAGSVIKEGSRLFCDTFSGELANYEPDDMDAITLTSDYTVIKAIELKENSKLMAGTILAKGSTYNNFTVEGRLVNPNTQYTLSTGETLKVSANNEEKTYEAGTKITVSGFTLISNNAIGGIPEGQILSNTQSIKILTEDVSKVSKNFLYFIKTRSNSPVILSNGNDYQLDEDEYFVYSDKTLTEYIILGPGTILSGTATLDNVYTGENVNDATTGAFLPVPSDIVAVSTETSTFLDGYSIEFSDTSVGGSLTNQYRPLSGTAKVSKTEGSGEDPAVFSSENEYSVRIVPILYTNALGVCEIPYPVTLKIKDSTTGIQLISITNSSNPSNSNDIPHNGDSVYLHSSELFYLAATSETNLLLPSGKSGKLCIYSEGTTQNIDASKEYPSPFEAIITGTSNNAYQAISISKLPGSKYLMFNVDKEPGKDLNIFYGTGTTPEASNLKPAKLAENWSSDADMSNVSVKSSVTSAKNLTVLIDLSDQTFEVNSIVIQLKQQTVKIWNVSYLSGFSEEIKYLSSENGSLLSATALDYFNPGELSKASSLISKITGSNKNSNGKDEDNKFIFNWLCSPSESVVHPTNSNEYFTEEHPYNRKTLPFIDFSEMSSKQTLKVLPIIGRFKS